MCTNHTLLREEEEDPKTARHHRHVCRIGRDRFDQRKQCFIVEKAVETRRFYSSANEPTETMRKDLQNVNTIRNETELRGVVLQSIRNGRNHHVQIDARQQIGKSIWKSTQQRDAYSRR